ncbi:AbrB/MazE/SpoVT family DNA-binding domain-containing protein [Aurantimonas sp. C2-6-R+9]|uniref:AbrB/MazE/SpoVT family DNA-binding domain-containing protein n=1 Tax=unclassified Aurantimonas TaxID=2638230 RepID=UPI002E19CA3F|nr:MULTISPECIES: AbrB/MazE/SpoVT family DNA-binding domain-containing protein [unclassified Aurantimonas]MEC5291624.1 AbrB/MazE/SpoVT family DNA-binding domain-containing protein [Aurantimonas sp. C2-3-R2]MEC5322067.1 AbrB/MazE/SpoVT family DNA-binding domain-containing protein [Aurantimonas sp. A3-2-R12]MEC5381764.1 AbrB/MazE/SpoVT family DNA-binding domain-containing protein [Aurantimonas sp. C2-6-R+9]MEC5412708.1 AbrB/MazE/SpoVT family DNA-binding domain-containing protein [Aurantimonas sp. 
MNTVIRKIGNSEGVILPREVLEQAGFATGDSLEIVRTPDGVQLVRADSPFGRQMRSAREGMQKYRTALRELAK